MLLQHEDQSGRARVLKFCSDIFERLPERKHILSPDDCNSHTDMYALPFSTLEKTLKKPHLGYPANPETIGEHIRKRRIELGLLQSDVAERLMVTTDSVTLWENNHAMPQIQHAPKIIDFLGYNPYCIETNTLGGKILMHRHLNGLSHKRMGKLVGVDASRIQSWEQNQSVPHSQNAKRLFMLLEANFV